MRRPWQLVIDVERDPGLPPFLQIAHALAGEIQRGRLRAGDRLPGSRQLAVGLRVHRNTVLAALAELIAEGWIETSPGRGTFVTRAIVNPRGRLFSRRLALRAHVPPHVPFALPEAPAAYRPPNLPHGTLNLSHGAPDLRLVPFKSIGRAYRRVIAQRGGDVLDYGDSEGDVTPSRGAGFHAFQHERPVGRPRRCARHSRQSDGIDARCASTAASWRRGRR